MVAMGNKTGSISCHVFVRRLERRLLPGSMNPKAVTLGLGGVQFNLALSLS